ncbi:MAG: hemerythrin domain-containing protein [Deltaproteobacteria bacterium]|nr:hemerythrin domain-containing protein [Deltaproteobacteria bacterium]
MQTPTTDCSPAGGIAAFLEADHRRLEALLDAAVPPGRAPDLLVYARFREGLLRHIGLEEKILLRAARGALGAPVPRADVLRRDHGDITSLLVPTPTPDIIQLLRRILEGHNAIEEGPGGVYDVCERALAARSEEIINRMQRAPTVPTLPFQDGERALEIVERIRRSWDVA